MPVDKHVSVKLLPHLLTPPKGSNVKYLNFAITKAAINTFAEILHAGIDAINMKHIKQEFSLKAWVQLPGVDLRVGPKPKLNFLE